MLIRALNLLYIIFIPMHPDYPVNQQMVFGAGAMHGVFEKHSVAHCFVGSGVELVEEGSLHVAGEFLLLY